MEAPTPIRFADGDGYERFMGQWSRAAGRIFLDWLDLPKGLSWLDVGCGTGAFTETIVQQCRPAHIVGIDPAETQVAYARTRYQHLPIEFEVGDAQSLPYPDRGFDVAASALVLNFIPDRAKAVAEMRRIVRPNGAVGAYVWDFAGGRGHLQHLGAALAKVTGRGTPAALNPESTTLAALAKLFQSSGLAGVKTRSIDLQITYADMDEYWKSNTQFVGPMVAAINGLADDQRQQLRRVLREILPVDAHGRVSYTTTVNAVKGVAT